MKTAEQILDKLEAIPGDGWRRKDVLQAMEEYANQFKSPIQNAEVTRFEVIDHTGRIIVKYGVNVELSYQDDGRTLKVFLTKQEDAVK